ncbi:hypothetical protein [Streptomyces albireticuli]|uniref:hypothetical protein n=1 Tax=Streptomyces albireticuli TaxID=1940 RepID=UPI00369BE208
MSIIRDPAHGEGDTAASAAETHRAADTAAEGEGPVGHPSLPPRLGHPAGRSAPGAAGSPYGGVPRR